MEFFCGTVPYFSRLTPTSFYLTTMVGKLRGEGTSSRCHYIVVVHCPNISIKTLQTQKYGFLYFLCTFKIGVPRWYKKYTSLHRKNSSTNVIVVFYFQEKQKTAILFLQFYISLNFQLKIDPGKLVIDLNRHFPNFKIPSVNITQVYKQQMVLHRVRRNSLRQQRLSRDLAVKRNGGMCLLIRIKFLLARFNLL